MNIASFYLPNWLHKDVTHDTTISALDDRGLITLVKPNVETSLRVKKRFEELQKANAKGMTSAAYLIYVN